MKRTIRNLIRKTIATIATLIMLSSATAVAQTTTTLFSDDFSSYTSGTYAGNPATTFGSGRWIVTANGTATNNPVASDGGAITNGSNLTLTNDVSATTNTQGRVSVSTTLSGLSGYNTTLSSNSGVLTWSWNMRYGRTGNGNGPAGFGNGNYGNAFVLASSGSAFGVAGATGYAVTFGNTSSPDLFRLVAFNNGLTTNYTTSGSTAGSQLIAGSGTFSVPDISGTNTQANDWFSFKVTYDPTSSIWSWFGRDDGAAAVDPLSGSLTTIGSFTESTAIYKNTSLGFMGGLWSYSTGGNITSQLDNIVLSITSSGSSQQTLTWNTTSGTWNTSATNWLNSGSSSAAFAQNDIVTFSGTGGGTITLSGSLAPSSFTVSASSGTYTFSGASASDKISGNTSLAKSGAGTAVFTSANDFSGGTNIAGGVVSISGSDQLGSGLITVNGGQLTSTAGSGVTLANALTVGGSNGTVDTGSQNLTINGAATLNGILTKSGNGTLSLGAVTSGSSAGSLGGVSVSAGNLALTSGVVNLFGNSTLTGNLVLNGATRINVSNGATLSGNGQLQLAATGATVSNLSSTAGGTISTPIALNSTGIAVTAGSWSGTAYTPNTFVSAIGATTTGTMTVSGTVSGNSDLVISNNTAGGGGGGMLVLSAANTYTGNTLISTNSPGAGVPSSLQLGVNNALPTTTGVIVGTGSNVGVPVLDMNGRNQQVAYLADGANVTAAKYLTIRNFGNADSTLTISGSITPGTAFSGVIGTGSTNRISLVKAGSNTQTLTGVNTYTGNTTISGGTLALSGAGSIASSPSITVGAGATLDVSAVTGGFTVVNGQTLAGNGTVAGGATLNNGSTIAPGTAGAGTLTTGNLTLSGGATYNFDFSNATSGAGIGWDLISSNGTVTLPGSAFTVAISGAATGFNNQNAAAWKILGASTLGGTYNAANFTVTNSLNTAGGSFSILNSGTDGTGLYLSFTPGQVLYWTANGSSLGGKGAWNASGSNWASDSTAVSGTTWNSAKTAIFDGTAGTVTVEAGGVEESLGMQFATTGYTLAGGPVNLTGSTALINSITTGSGVTATLNNPLAGSNGFTKAGPGTLSLGGNNTVAGTVSISAGTLQTTAAERIADTADVTVGSGATLQLGGNETVGSLAGTGNVTLGTSTLTAGGNNTDTTFAGVASGSGGLTKAGTGTFTVSGSNTYTGATTVSAGTLVTSAANRIADTSAVVVGSGATFQIGGAETIGSLAGSGTVALGSFTLTTGSDGSSTTFSGAAGGTGGLTKIGAGVQTLSGQNTYSGATTISAGTLATSANDVIADTSAVIVAAGATFQVGGNDTIAALTGLGTATVGSGNTLTVSPAATGTFAGTLAGAGTFAKAGASTLALTGTANTITNLTVAAGALSLGNTGALPTSGAVAINDAAKITLAVGGTYGGSGQTVTLAANQSDTPLIDITSGSTATLRSNVSLAGSAANRVEANGATGSLTLAGNVTGSGSLLKQAGGNLILSGSNTGSWGTQVGNGTLTVNAGSGLGSGDLAMNQTSTNNATLALNESVTVGNLTSSYSGTGNNVISIASGKTLTVTQTVSGTYGAAGPGSSTSSISGSGGLTKAGGATLTLAGANTYTGPTTVSAGTLATTVANAVSANTTVAGGATLALGGAQTFTSLSGAGTLAAGSSAVTLNNSSAATIGAITGDAGASLVKSGAGELTLAANNSGFGGSVSVTNGVVRTTNGGALGTGGVSVAGNGTLFGAAGTAIANAITVSTGSSVLYSQNFNSIGAGLPANWTINTGATASGLGTSGAFTTTTLPWSDSGGAFKNYASATLGSGATPAAQNAYADRALGVQQTNAFGDPGASFNYAFSTTGQTIQGISFDLMQLNVNTRDTTWSMQYGLGASPTSFTTLGTFVTGSTFGITPRTFTTADFGTSLDNQANVVFRVAALTASAGSGSRDAIAIDNFNILTPSAAAVIGSDITSGTATFSGGMTLNGPATLTAASGGTSLFSGAISGTGGVTKSGAGTVILTGSNTYSGGTTINAGAVSVATNAALGASSAGITLGGGSLVATNDFTLSSSRTITASAATTSGIDVVDGKTLTFGGNFAGSGNLDKRGVGTLTVSGSSPGYTGRFTVSAGTMNVNGNGLFANATLQQTGGKLVFSAGGGTIEIDDLEGDDGELEVGDGDTVAVGKGGNNSTYAGRIRGNGGFEKQGSGKFDLDNDNDFAGATSVAGGILEVRQGGKLSNTAGVTVANGGILKVNGEVGRSDKAAGLTVQSGGVLGGSGRVFGTIGGAGQVGPGNSPGIFTSTATDPSIGLDYAFELTGTGAPVWSSGTASVNDVWRLTGASPFASPLSGANVIDIYFGAGFSENNTYLGGFFTDATATSFAGFQSTVNGANYNYYVLDAAGSVTYNGNTYRTLAQWNAANSVDLSVQRSVTTVASADFSGGTVTSGQVMQFVVVPEPSTLVLAGIGIAFAGSAALRRRRAA